MPRDLHSPRATLAGQSFSRILIVKPSSLGDVVHALPVLHGLRTRYPQATIDWLVNSSLAPLIEEHPQLSRIVPFDRRRYARLASDPKAARDFARFVRELRKRKYEVVIDLQGLFRTGFLAWASGAPVRIGFRDAREGARFFYTHRLQVDDPNMHAVDRNYLAASMLGFADVPIVFEIGLTDRLRREAAGLLRDNGAAEGRPVAVVAPGARWETKRWPAERFAETIDALQATSERRVVLVGGPDEYDLCARIAALCQSTPIVLAGQTSLRQLAAVIELADVVLCHDSGAMHLAAALGRPLLCLTGPTNPRRTGPYRRLDDVLRVDLDCSPCYLRRLSRCHHDHQCMLGLDTKQVIARAQALLERDVVRSC
ncbi:MAG: lipopolysaccharide heptosyltransferase I [Planctomycetes bacterium]|nr:lipopolysaccharide heptosyltransferase I [Planctomycetota bacterium]